MEKNKIVLPSRHFETCNVLEKLELVNEIPNVLVYKLITPYSYRFSSNPETKEIEWVDLSGGPMITLGYTLTFEDGIWELFKIEFSDKDTLLKFKLT